MRNATKVCVKTRVIGMSSSVDVTLGTRRKMKLHTYMFTQSRIVTLLDIVNVIITKLAHEESQIRVLDET
jgi:hypothetical protein